MGTRDENGTNTMTDQEARTAIMQKFYEYYRQHGLHVIVMARQVSSELQLDEQQGRRCFDYLTAKGLIKPMTLGGGYSPTVSLVDQIEAEEVDR
jgi:predicted transcriptional regulator